MKHELRIKYAAAGRIEIVAPAIQLVLAMGKLLARLLSASTTSERQRDFFDASQALAA